MPHDYIVAYFGDQNLPIANAHRELALADHTMKFVHSKKGCWNDQFETEESIVFKSLGYKY
jgi:hypothetical protein